MSHGPVMSMAIQRRPSLGRRVSDLRADQFFFGGDVCGGVPENC